MYGFVRDVLAEKGFQVHTVPSGASVREAARRMSEAGIGSLLVTRLDQPVGIFTERDALTRVIDAGVDVDRTAVGDVMASAMLTVRPAMPVDEAMELMTNSRCRHLPVVDGTRLAGIVSIGDLMRWVLIHQQEDLRHMTDYITGRA
jgi:CBS domain-containing protein